MRLNVKKKLTLIRQNRNRTGASPIDKTLSEFEEKLISICGINILDGNQRLDEIGLPTNNGLCSLNAYIESLNLNSLFFSFFLF